MNAALLWRRWMARPASVLAISLLAALGLFALLAPVLSPHDGASIDWEQIAVAPGDSASHWLGTDRLGRDVLVRVAEGTRVSLALAIVATLLSLVLGTLYGAVAGYGGRWVDAVMMRLVDVCYALPFVFLVIVITVAFGRDPATLVLAIAAVGWLTVARVVRGEAARLRHRAFIDAAIVGGASTWRVLRRHLIPNLLAPVIVYATLTVPQLVLLESFLSFLGIGIQEPLASLGNLIADGAAEMETAPWLLLAPALVLVTVVWSLSQLGDALRDALDPRHRP